MVFVLKCKRRITCLGVGSSSVVNDNNSDDTHDDNDKDNHDMATQISRSAFVAGAVWSQKQTKFLSGWTGVQIQKLEVRC